MDTFRLLTTGATFDKRKFVDVADVFKPGKQSATTSSTLPTELDFFGTQSTAADTTQNKKRKREVLADASDGVVASSSTQIPLADDEDATSIRRKNRIKVTGSDVPDPISTWNQLTAFYVKGKGKGKGKGKAKGKAKAKVEAVGSLMGNLREMGFKQPTGIQMQAIPILLSDRDLLACAPTGSGKTGAFLMPLFLSRFSSESLESEDPTTSGATGKKRKEGEAQAEPDVPVADGEEGAIRVGPMSLVVEPTRELARQVYKESLSLAAGTSFRVCLLGEGQDDDGGGDDVRPNDCDLLISTPLKLVYAAKSKQVDLTSVRHLILDEADQQFELGFLPQTDEILAACTNPGIRKAMFSATISSSVEELARTVLGVDLLRVIVGHKDSVTETITQDLRFTGTEDGKLHTMRQILTSGELKPPALIFVQSIERATDLFRQLVQEGVNVDVMHSERTKKRRDQVMRDFSGGKTWVLICTDVMSRGVDFKGVNLVINYDFPQSAQSYIHRIGRTGRAGRPGRAITFFTTDDAPHLRSIVNIMRNSGCEVPGWMLELKAPSQNEKKKLKRRPVDRDVVGGGEKSGRRGVTGKGKGAKGKRGKEGKMDGNKNMAAKGVTKRKTENVEVDLSDSE